MTLLPEQPNNDSDELHLSFGFKGLCNAKARAKGRNAIQVLWRVFLVLIVTGLVTGAATFLKVQNDEAKQPSIPQLNERNK